MLSVLIPVYNFDVRQLVKDIQSQSITADVDFEILCIDDGSDWAFKNTNKTISNLPFVKYIELEKNIGRSAIRNLLAKNAKYDQLLFIDCDSGVTSEYFIKNYITHLSNNHLLYGGRNYFAEKPANNKLVLHWLYGSNREVIPVEKRKQFPYKSFQTNNFVIPKSIYLDIRLDETLKGYGHEDTLFGDELKIKKIPIIHIENPLYHLGLETVEQFIKKTDEGIQNLHFLIVNNKVSESIKIVSTFNFLNKYQLVNLYLLYYKMIKRRVIKSLYSDNPRLKYFDFYKLTKLIELNRIYKSSL